MTKCNHLCNFGRISDRIQTVLITVLIWLVGRMGYRLVSTEATILPSGWMMFDPALAESIGLNKAVIYQKIGGWVEHNRRKGQNIKGGRAWSYNTIPNWHREFCWLSKNYVGELLRQLETSGLLVSDRLGYHPSDQTKWYTTAAIETSTEGATQIGLWPNEIPTLREQKVGDVSSKESTKLKPAKSKAKTTPAARGYEAAHVGDVAQFSIPSGELPEGKSKTLEVAEVRDEREAYAFTGTPGTRVRNAYPPVPPNPPSGDESTEEETVSVDQTQDAPPDEVVKFFDGCTVDEVSDLTGQYGLDVIRASIAYTRDERNHVKNPAGFVRERLSKGWRPPARKDTAYLVPADNAYEDTQEWRAAFVAEGGVL